MKSILCFYHYPCNDGSAAAAALDYRLRDANYLDGEFEITWCPLSYMTEWEEDLPDEYVEETIIPEHPVVEIYIVDLSISKVKVEQVLRRISELGKLPAERPRVICIDHHMTAVEREAELKEFCDETYIKIGEGLSGATLVWNYMNEKFSPIETPELLRYVADQDIWEWKLPDSRAINAALNVLEGSFEVMSAELEESMRSGEKWKERRKQEGEAITSMVDSQVARSVRQALNLHIRFFELRVVNSTSFSSELGNALCEQSENAPDVLAVIFTVQADWGVRCSVRSIPGGRINARMFCERYNGGGHDHAAGCRFGSFEEFHAVIEEIRENGWPEEADAGK